MCDPVTISLVATLAGTAASAAGQAKAQKAQDGAREAERIRQKGLQSESDALLGQSLSNASKESQDSQQANAEGERKAAYDAATAASRAPLEAVGSNLAGDQSANALIASETAKASNNALGYAGQQGLSKAALQGFGDLQFNNALYNARQLQGQARVGDFMKGSAGVLPYEMEAASHKGDGLKTLGSALSTAGSIAGMGAGAGWWGANTAAPATSSVSKILANSVQAPQGVSFLPINFNDPNWLKAASANLQGKLDV